jgi:hypothetical protein
MGRFGLRFGQVKAAAQKSLDHYSTAHLGQYTTALSRLEA